MSRDNNKFGELISKSLDDELTASEGELLKSAIKESADLRAFQKQLDKIKQDIQLEPFNTPNYLKSRIGETIKKQYTQKTTIIKSHATWPILFSGKGVLAAGCTVLFLFFGFILTTKLPSSNINSSPIETAFFKIDAARTQYLGAIASLETLADERMEPLPDEVAKVLADNLQLIELAIAVCEQALREDENSYIAYQALSQAYYAKTDLLMLIINS